MKLTHRLQTVEVRLYLPESPGADGPISGFAAGYGTSRRAHLWSQTGVWGDESDLRHSPADWAHHILLAALQDLPNDNESLTYALTGGLGYQDPLF